MVSFMCLLRGERQQGGTIWSHSFIDVSPERKLGKGDHNYGPIPSYMYLPRGS
jgi:hypothetical protein